ncbi:MAG TPA: PQQ-binding-like beta-propeller repeat protein, partial [Chloroflexia bacterium]|nr:PQQ-binding-like beta-propeller repeat protein [Chloroflexia bacterium]
TVPPTSTSTSTPTSTPTATNTPTAPPCTPQPASWASGPALAQPVARAAGVYFPPNGHFYLLGGRSSDSAGADLLHPAEYDPATSTWTTKAATFATNQVGDLAAGVLTVAGTPYIVAVGGAASGGTTTTGEVRLYNPTADSLTVLSSDPWPPGATASTLPGGYAVQNDKLYILGGFQLTTGMVAAIWEFDPARPAGSRWLQKAASLPIPLGAIPAATIGSYIYTGGGTTWSGSAAVDDAHAFRYDPAADLVLALPDLPQATGETRAVAYRGQLWVLGGGRTAPNPSSAVQVYDPGTNHWSSGPAFATPRRNFPADAGGANIYLAGGYAPAVPGATLEIYQPAGVCAVQWTATPGPPGAALAAPGIFFDAAHNTQVFVGGNNGVKKAYSGTGTPLWSVSLHGAVGDRAPIVPSGGSNWVFVTSQDGWVTALDAATGGLGWQQQIAASVVAGIAYQPNVAVGGTVYNLVFAGTYTDTTPAGNALVALDAATGRPVWTFTGTATATLGLIPTEPVVDWATNTIYFGTKDVTGGGGGGIWAVRTTDGTARWFQGGLGAVSGGVPSLGGAGHTLYLATVRPGPVFTLQALDTTNGGAVQWSYTPPAATGQFLGVPWVEGAYVYASAGDAVYALQQATGNPHPGWTAGPAPVPGAASPLLLSAPGNASLYVGANNGYFYRLNMADGTLVRRLPIGSGAVGDATYDYLRDAFYLCLSGVLFSVQDNY